jgi:hypothetical protein
LLAQSGPSSPPGAPTTTTASHLTLYPYLLSGTWVFDDPRTCLHEEAFVLGATEAITKLVSTKQISTAEKGFSLTFSGEAVDGYDAELRWVKAAPMPGGVNPHWTPAPGDRARRFVEVPHG